MMSRQLCPETSWAFTWNLLMENMSRAPCQSGWLGRAFVGPAGIWSLEGETGPGRAGHRGFPQHLHLFQRRSWSLLWALEHWPKHGLVQGEAVRWDD